MLKPDEFDLRTIWQGMISGQGEAVRRTYHKFTGKSGRTWLVADQPNAGDNVYVTNNPQNSGGEGFGGAVLGLPLVDGGVFDLRGGWHSNSEALYQDTGIDVRDKHLTFVVIGTGHRKAYEQDWMQSIVTGILYKDDDWTVGPFDRDEEIAARLIAETGAAVYRVSHSQGGSSSGFEWPEGKQPKHCKDCMAWHSPGEHKQEVAR